MILLFVVGVLPGECSIVSAMDDTSSNESTAINNNATDIETEDNDKIKSCPICFEVFGATEAFSLVRCRNARCPYLFHEECLGKWFETNPSCPLCKKKEILLPEKKSTHERVRNANNREVIEVMRIPAPMVDRRLIYAIENLKDERNEKKEAAIIELLSSVIDINCKSESGNTALHQAVRVNRVDLVEMLLNHGAQVNLPNEVGNTALHVAAYIGCLAAIKVLLQHQASPSIKNKAYKTAYDIAVEQGHLSIARELFSLTSH